MKFSFFIILFIAVFGTSDAQVFYYRSYSYQETTTYYDNSSYYGWQFANNTVNKTFDLIDNVFTEKKRKEEKLEYEEKMRKKVDGIKKYYESLAPNYPEKVIDGWHDVAIIGSDDYIADRKVYVQNNKITKVVLDNWYELALNFSGPINKGKTGIQLKEGKGREEGVLEAYFINAIADPTANAAPPLQPGKVTFWTNSKKYKNMAVYFVDAQLGNLLQRHNHNTPPACGSEKEMVVIYKPGTYDYKVTLNGSRFLNGKVIIKEGQCESVQLNKSNLLNKD